MELPKTCPLDGTPGCKKKQCHLFHIDWRSGDENCTLGYGPGHQTGREEHFTSGSQKVRALRNNISSLSGNFPEGTASSGNAPAINTEIEKSIPSKKGDSFIKDLNELPPAEDIRNDNTNTSQNRNNLNFMDDLPEDYEKEFWA